MKPTTPPKDTAETWEEKFDEHFEFRNLPDERVCLKNFIRSELAHLLEEVESVIGEDEPQCENDPHCGEDPDGCMDMPEKRFQNELRDKQHKALTQLRKKYLGL